MAVEMAYRDGDYVRLDDVQIGIRTHALQYGTGVFEGIRSYWAESDRRAYIFRPLDHYRRLIASARMLGMRVKESADELCSITAELIRRNDTGQDVYIRPMVFKSGEVLGLWHQGIPESTVVFTVPFGRYMPGSGVRCCVSSWRRPDGNALPSRAKFSGSYVNSAVARAHAQTNGYDEAIMLSSRGYVSEGTGENVFLVIGGKLVTPCAGEDLLAGITRDTLIVLAARELDLVTVERDVNRSELYVADEAFLCGTAAEVVPVVEVDGHPVGDGTVGPITGQLQRIYNAVVHGERADYADWCLSVTRSSVAADGDSPPSHQTAEASTAGGGA
jgi:branched-chain amino acid aminotransferase